MKTAWILPEFCPGVIYHGWHLYERHARPDRGSLDPWGWGWLRSNMSLWPVVDMLKEAGLVADMPPVDSHGYDFTKWFVGRWPAGLVVDRADRREYANPRAPSADLAVPLLYHSARGLILDAKLHGEGAVEGAPGHPRADWTSLDYQVICGALVDGMWLRDCARATRRGLPFPPAPPPTFPLEPIEPPAPPVFKLEPSPAAAPRRRKRVA